MKLLHSEISGNRVHSYYQHYGDDGRKKITVETKEDVSPIIQGVKELAQNQNKKSDFRFKCAIPATVVDDICKISAKSWGITPKQAYEEIVSQETDRAKKAMKMLTSGRDFRKLQAKHY